MSSFINSISSDPVELKKKKQVMKDPFSFVTKRSSVSTTIFGYNLDTACVRLSTINDLRKHINYIKLKDISPRCSAMKYFTIGVIVEIGKKKIVISDLQNIKVDVYTDDVFRFSNHDVVAITNAEVGHAISIKKSNQIIKIGTNEGVIKCKKADYADPECCIWVDERKGVLCAHHCAQGYIAASKARMVLRQSVPVKAPRLDTSKLIKADLSNTGAADQKEAKIYLETHPHSRSAIIARKLNEPDTSSIAKGFKPGDIINLDF